MVRLGFRAGLVLLSLLAGCSDDTASAGDTSKASAGGGAPSFAALEAKVGRVLVVGESDGVAHFEHEYRGLAPSAGSSAEVVSCDVDGDGGRDRVLLRIEAGPSGASSPQVSARFRLGTVEPQELNIPYSTDGDSDVRVQLNEAQAAGVYEYQFGSDADDELSVCHLVLKSFDAERVTGTAVCRHLLATAASIDASGQSGDNAQRPGSANATLDFSCPFKTLSLPGGGGAGGSSAGGSGGQSGSSGSSSVAGTAGGGVAGTGGGGKRCSGLATSCFSRSGSSCEQGSGCILDENCDGFVQSCYGQIGVFSCTAIQGCFWSSSSQRCSGSAWSCSLFSGSATCSGQPGCSWSSDCTGSAPLCSTLSEATCSTEPGCYLQ